MRNLSYENEFRIQFHFHANQSDFHKNSFALRLAMKQRHRGTRKWPISIEDRMQGSLWSLFTLKQVLAFKQSLYGSVSSVRLLTKYGKSFSERKVYSAPAKG